MFTSRRQILPILLCCVYFLVIHWSMGLRPEHLLFAGFLLGCYYIHPRSRRFVLDFLPVIFFAILYDFLRIYPKSWAGPIHVEWPYRLELALFGFMNQGQKIIPCDYFRLHHWPAIDLLAGVAYSLHMVVPMGFAFLVWLRRPATIRRFNQVFLVVNLFAFATYLAVPVAPPWYVEQYGFEPAHWGIPASAAGLIHFDHLIGYPYFEEIYAKSSWVFGALPSMHAGFPLLVLIFARKAVPKAFWPLAAYMLLIWFSAVYLRHHYVIDLIAGVLYVLSTLVFFRWSRRRYKPLLSRSSST